MKILVYPIFGSPSHAIRIFLAVEVRQPGRECPCGSEVDKAWNDL